MNDEHSTSDFPSKMKFKIGLLIEKYLHILLLVLTITTIFVIYLNKARISIFLAIPAREAQTASLTRYFYNFGIDLFDPKYDLTPLPQHLLQEFPIYQAVVAILYHIAGFHEFWGKILSVLALGGSLIYIFLIGTLFLKNKYVSVITTIMFAVTPYTLRFFPIFMIDPATLFLTLVTLYHGIRWIEKRNKVDYVVFFTAGLLAMLIKFIFLIPVCVPLFVLFFISLKKPLRTERKRIIQFLIPFFCWGVALIGWFIWSNYLNNQTALQAFNDTFVQYSVLDKWIGTWAMRTDPNYLSSLKWIVTAFVPSWISPSFFYGLLFLGFIVTFSKSRKFSRILLTSWVIGFVFILLVFFPALSTHIYYWLPAIPITTFLLANLFDVIFGFLSDTFIHIKINPKHLIMKFFLLLIAGEISIFLGLQTYLKGFKLFDYRSPNQFDYYTGLALFIFFSLLWLLIVYCLLYRQIPVKMIVSTIIICLFSSTFYSNLFYPSERYWEMPPGLGYHWSTMPLLLNEANYIKANHDAAKPVAIVTKYNYYPHILYLSNSHGYTLRFPENDINNSQCVSANGFPFVLSNPCIYLIHDQGIEDVFVVFYDETLDMQQDDFKKLAPLLHLQLIDQMTSTADQYGNVLHYHIDLP